MKICRGISISVLIILFFSVDICYGQNVVKQSYTKGVEFAVQGNFKEAKGEFEKALKVDSSYRAAKQALKVIEDVIDKKIENKTTVHYFKGAEYITKKKWERVDTGQRNRCICQDTTLSGRSSGTYYFSR